MIIKRLKDLTGVSFSPGSHRADFSCHLSEVSIDEEVLRKRVEDSAMFFDTRIERSGNFLNLHLSKRCWIDILGQLSRKDRQLVDLGLRTVHLEFISANPTGPLTVASGRHAVVGHYLQKLIESSLGTTCHSEYYVNDSPYSTQMQELIKSIRLLHTNPNSPEITYRGDHLLKIAETVLQGGDEVHENVVTAFMKDIARTLQLLLPSLTVSKYVCESRHVLQHLEGLLDQVLKDFEKAGYIVADEDTTLGAVQTQHRALMLDNPERKKTLTRSDGTPTYMLGDIVYHLGHKFPLHHQKYITILGSDHKDHSKDLADSLDLIQRIRGVQIPVQPEVVVLQNVVLVRSGRVQVLHKRQGEAVWLQDLIDMVGQDLIVYYFARYSNNTTVRFDLDLHNLKNKQNSLWYVQYTYARACQVEEKNPRIMGMSGSYEYLGTDYMYRHFWRLLSRLEDFENILERSWDKKSPSLVVSYLEQLCQEYNSLYDTCLFGEDSYMRTVNQVFIRTVQQIGQMLGMNLPRYVDIPA